MYIFIFILCLVMDPCATTGKFEHVANKHAIGAEPQPNIGTLAECKKACQQNDTCTAVDWEWVLLFSISFNSSPPGQDGRHIADDTFNCIFVIEKFCIKISVKFVPKGPINNNLALVQIMAWCRLGAKPLSEPMLIRFTDAYMRHYGGGWVNSTRGVSIQ